MGHFFDKKSLNMGPVFYQKILKHGSTFLTEPKFLGFRMAKTPKIAKFLKNGPFFQEKNLKNGYPFLPKSPLKMGRGFEARAAHPCPTQIWVPPPPGFVWMLVMEVPLQCLYILAFQQKKYFIPGEGEVLSPKSYMDVPAEPQKFDFLFTNFLPIQFPTISIPFPIEKHLILTKWDAFLQ